MKKLGQTVVTNRALFARIKRRLAREREHLRTCRDDSKWSGDLGRYYIVYAENDSGHWRSRTVVATHVELESFGRALGVLREHEAVKAGA